MKQLTLILLCYFLFVFFNSCMALAGEVLFQENFESGWGDYWGADNGLWEIGVPTAGPEGACTGKQCAGTILDGNYGAHTDSRLITPTLYLPETGPAEEIHFRFMNWFSFSSHDSGHVQISVFDETSSTWSDWEPLVPDITHTSSSWSMMDADLTLYACQRVKIAFNHTAARDRYNHGSESTGWYIDDVRLVVSRSLYLDGQENFFEGFESGWGECWGADNGLWEIGVPTAGPEGACTGKQCAGTILDGNYGAHTDSRLITPPLNLPKIEPAEEIHFRFMNWFSFSSHDSGHVQISVFDETSSTWSDWEPLVPDITHTSSSWSMMDADLTLYACQRVKIAFNHTAARDRYNHGSESTGWYIDDVRLVLPERFMEPTPEAGPPDIYEPDDIKDQAGIFDMSSTIKRVHSFHKQGNQDWIKLYCSKNQVYTFNITKTGPRVNMVFNIYDGISDSLLKRFYVPTECEKSFSWKCPEDGLYYVATAQANPDIYGEGTQYSLRVYPSFTVEPETLELSESSSATITIRGGKGPYKVASSDETVVSAQLFTHAGVFAKVEAFSAGTATITISDSSINGEAGQVSVKVTESDENSPPAVRSKAIIVAGGGPYQGNALWDTTQLLAKNVYITLLYQGFTRDTIHYLTPDTNVDMDGNGKNDDADAFADKENLDTAITEWAVDADDVVVFLTDHGGRGNFQLNETRLLQSEDLDLWLDELQQKIPGTVTVIYDACHSGSFLPALTPPEDKKRIVISSTGAGQEAYFTSLGDLSFTSFFWQHIINGMNVFDAYLTAKNSIEYTYGRQTPSLDDNGNGLGNEDADGELAKSTFLGKGLISGGGIPVIESVSPGQQILQGETSAVLSAENVVDSDGIQRVWAVITRPDHLPKSTDDPVLTMPVVEFTPVGSNRYEGVYNEFNVPGTYRIAVYARDNLGSLGVPMHTTVVQSPGDGSCAAFDANSGLLSIPCLDFQGTAYALSLAFTGTATQVLFQLMPGIARAGDCQPSASFNLQTGILHIDKLEMGESFWVNLMLSDSDPLTFSLVDLGKNITP